MIQSLVRPRRGRPRLPVEQKLLDQHFTILPAHLRYIEELAQRRDVSMSQVVRAILDAEMSRHPLDFSQPAPPDTRGNEVVRLGALR